MLRTELGAALAARDLTDPGSLLARRGARADRSSTSRRAALAAEVVPRLLSGAEMWCQGFSEPGTGSDLGVPALPRGPRRRRRDRGDVGDQRPEGLDEPGPVLRPLRAAHPHRSCRLAPPRASPRSSSTWTRRASPSRRLEMLNGVREFAEVFFDDVVVPADRILGEVDGGWAVAMSILPYERSSCFWQRIAYLYRRLEAARRGRAGRRARPPPSSATRSSSSTRSAPARAPRSTGSRTGRRSGAETSIDKVLVATAEQTTYDAARRLLPGVVEIDDQRDRCRLAGRVPLLARCDDLRRHRRGPAQHHRPTAAGPRGRAVMDPAERQLLAAVRAGRARRRRRTRRGRCRARRARLARDARGRATRRRRVSCSPRSARRTARRPRSTTSSSSALGVTPRPDLAVLLPRFGTWQPPGRIGAERCRARGLATARVATAARAPRRVQAGSEASTVTVTAAAADVRPVHGIDPTAGLHLVRAELGVAVETRLDLTVWDAAVASGRRAVAQQIAGSVPGDARPRPDPRGRTCPVRPADRVVPSGAPPARRRARGDRGARRDARRGRRRPGSAHRRTRQGDGGTHRGEWSRRTASRCSPASASPPTTRSTASSSGRWLLEGLFGSADEIAADLGRHLLETRRVPTLIDL